MTATGRIAVRIPDLAPLGWGLVAGGGVLTVLALALIWIGAAGLGRRHTPGPPAPPVIPLTPLPTSQPAPVG